MYMGNSLSRLSDAKAITEASPDEINSLTASVVDAARSTEEMTEELSQLGVALDKLDEKNKVYKNVRKSVRMKMQGLATEL